MQRVLGVIAVQQPPLGVAEQPELYKLKGEAIIRRVFHEVKRAVDDIAIVATESSRTEQLVEAVPDLMASCRFVRAENKGWEAASLVSAALQIGSEVTVIVPANAPLVTTDLILLLLQLVEGRDAIFLRDKGGAIDLLMAAYRNSGCSAIFSVISNDKRLELREVPDGIRRSMVLNPNALKALDPQLGALLRVRSRADLRLAKRFLDTER